MDKQYLFDRAFDRADSFTFGYGGSGLGFAGGKAIALNGYTATRTGAGTTYGTVA